MAELMTMAKRKTSDTPSDMKKRPKKFAVEIDEDIESQLRGLAGLELISVPVLVNSILRGAILPRLKAKLEAMGIGDIPPPTKK